MTRHIFAPNNNNRLQRPQSPVILATTARRGCRLRCCVPQATTVPMAPRSQSCARTGPLLLRTLETKALWTCALAALLERQEWTPTDWSAPPVPLVTSVLQEPSPLALPMTRSVATSVRAVRSALQGQHRRQGALLAPLVRVKGWCPRKAARTAWQGLTIRTCPRQRALRVGRMPLPPPKRPHVHVLVGSERTRPVMPAAFASLATSSSRMGSAPPIAVPRLNVNPLCTSVALAVETAPVTALRHVLTFVCLVLVACLPPPEFATAMVSRTRTKFAMSGVAQSKSTLWWILASARPTSSTPWSVQTPWMGSPHQREPSRNSP